MRRSFFCQLIVGVLYTAVGAMAFAADAKDEAIQKDRKLIEGTWRIVALVLNGTDANAEDARKLTVVNGADGSWSLFSDGKAISKGTSTIDPTQKPKTIDFMTTEGEAKGNRYQGIYELTQNSRKMCFAPPEAARPKEFTSSQSNQHTLLTLEREKAK